MVGGGEEFVSITRIASFQERGPDGLAICAGDHMPDARFTLTTFPTLVKGPINTVPFVDEHGAA